MSNSIQKRQKTFSIAQILSVATGILVCPIDDVYGILDWMTGDGLFTHQLPRAARWAEPILRSQSPWLAGVDGKGIGRENWSAWLADMTARFGAEHVVFVLDTDSWLSKHPIAEAVDMMDAKQPGDRCTDV